MARTTDVLELPYAELCVLQWLRINNGKATLTANAVARDSLFMVPDHLLKVDYVKTYTDQSCPKTVHYILTEGGRAALDMSESMASFAHLPRRCLHVRNSEVLLHRSGTHGRSAVSNTDGTRLEIDAVGCRSSGSTV